MGRLRSQKKKEVRTSDTTKTAAFNLILTLKTSQANLKVKKKTGSITSKEAPQKQKKNANTQYKLLDRDATKAYMAASHGNRFIQ